MNPRITEAALDKLRPGWRERRAKRKSPWNLLCGLLGFGLAMLAWYYLFQAAWWLHLQRYPAQAALQKEFWRAGLSARAFLSSFLLLMPLAVPAFVGGFLSANLIVWLIPPARRSMEREAAGDHEMTFAGSNAGLIKWGGIASVAAVILAAIGALTLASLQ
ncbi:MAG TPA: hypothetical protein VLW52_11595 [Opitutaceae bacterium]|nr:hypothetical protein [Opitutaceae bacterium]